VKTSAWIIVLIVVAALAAFGGFWLGRDHEAAHEDDAPSSTEESEPKPVARVVVAPLKRGTITSTITDYGTIVAQPGDVRVVSVPFEARIVHAMVTPGQQVSAGAELVRIGPSPDMQVALEEAKLAAEAAGRDLKAVEQRFADHLATNQELSQVQQTARSAELKLSSLQQRGVADEQTLKADAGGIVAKINVQEGQIVAAGTSLVEIASGNRIEAALAVDPADAATLKVDQPVKLSLVGGSRGSGAEPMDGKIRVIGRRVDPATRMTSVIVTVPPDRQLMLDTFVRGQITRDSAEGLIVPRDAVLPAEEGAFELFTVANGHAKKHEVKLGLENDQQTQVIGEAEQLKPGDLVVVQGNYQLEDGMEVVVAETTPAPVTAATTTSPAAAEGAP
jgi:RND family efflux transporter MFP subunit